MNSKPTSLRQRRYELPEDSGFLVLGPYKKPEEMALAEFPRGTTCWYVIVKWRGMELFIARANETEAMVAAAQKILELAGI